MYNNSKIKWQHGMEFTAEVFQHQDADLDARQQMTVHAAIGDGRIGLLPGSTFVAEGSFVDRTYEMVGLQCTALLESGRIISVNENLSVDIPALKGTEFFICLGMAEGKVHDFERDGIPYEGPVYELSIHTLEEMEGKDLMPLKRMVITDSMLNIDKEYIVPTLAISSDERILNHVSKCEEALRAIFNNANMPLGDCKRSLLHLYMRLKSINKRSSVSHLVELYQELALTVEFYIIEQMSQYTQKIPDEVIRLNNDLRRDYNQANLALFLTWMEEYLTAQIQLLDVIVIDDQAIDYDKMKAEIKAELTPELTDALYEKLKADLTTAISDDLMNRLTELINNRILELHPELVNQLHNDLHDPLYQELYDSLYAELSKLSYKPVEQVVDAFVPLI